jgi:hypothetical protein
MSSKLIVTFTEMGAQVDIDIVTQATEDETPLEKSAVEHLVVVVDNWLDQAAEYRAKQAAARAKGEA